MTARQMHAHDFCAGLVTYTLLTIRKLLMVPAGERNEFREKPIEIHFQISIISLDFG